MKQSSGQRSRRLIQKISKQASLAGLAIATIGLINLGLSQLHQKPEPEAIAQTLNGVSGISTPKLFKLKNIGIRILLPEYIPDGFKLKSIESKRCAPGMGVPCGHFPQYEIIYSNAQQLCFAIESRPLIFDRKVPETSSRLNTQTFGKATLYHGSLPDQPNQNQIFSEWLERDRQYYRFTQVEDTATDCKGTVDVEEAIAITESLVFVN
jgi:hypothetical protein